MLGLGLSIPRCAVRAGDALTREVAALFSAGEQGAWYDLSDFSTMFQNAAGTIPVTTVGQAVGRILDKSGRGNHATQTTDTKRPVLQQDASGRYYLLFDGIDDALQTASVNFTGTDKVTVWAGVRKLSDSSFNMIVELSTSVGTINPGSFYFASLTSGRYEVATRGTVGVFLPTANNSFVAPITNVITSLFVISTDTCNFRANGALITSSSSDQGTGTYGNYPLYIGSRGATSLPFNGRLYSLIIRGAQSTSAQISTAENYVNSKTGAYV